MIILKPYENTNCFCTLEEAESYIADFKIDSAGWHELTNETKEKALKLASLKLSNMNWAGDQYSSTQAMAWPRIVNRLKTPFFYEFPSFLKNATIELAFSLINGASYSTNSDGIKSISFSGMKMDFKDNESAAAKEVGADVWAFIDKYIKRGNTLYRC